MSSFQSLFVRALHCEPLERPPVWFMRQAGRYMPQYREVRQKTDFLSLCKNPSLCAEVMATAVEELDVDAAIIFSDLLPILEPLGFDLEYLSGDGPVIRNPLRTPEDFERIRELTDIDQMAFQFETVRRTREMISQEKGLIGFVGAPFTLASYAIEGKGNREFENTRNLMRSNSSLWHDFLSLLARSVARCINEQLRAGADAIQLFDSWAGVLTPKEYQHYVFPHLEELFDLLDPNALTIYFWTGNPRLLPIVTELPVACIGIDHHISWTNALKQIPTHQAIQGNLDPELLLSDPERLSREANRILSAVGNRPGYIFNLGHGILKQTPVEMVKRLVRQVKQWHP